jgi:hypothetical protein
MTKNRPPEEIHRFIVEDFEGAWNSVAANTNPGIGRGNFMFARQAMNLLEFGAMLCEGDNSHGALNDFSTNLNRIEPKYFTRLPSPCASTKDFTLPHLGNISGDLLLWALFDLIRHGLAHQYQQITAQLNNNTNFLIMLTGAEIGRFLNVIRTQRPTDHLAFHVESDDLIMVVHPAILFLDFKDAINNSALLSRNLTFQYFTRPFKSRSRYYNFDINSLESSLDKAGHFKI